MDGRASPRPVGRAAPVLRARALASRHQPADPLGTSTRARAGRDRRSAELRGVASAGRVRADRQGGSAPPDHRRDADVRTCVARSGTRARARAGGSRSRRRLNAGVWPTRRGPRRGRDLRQVAEREQRLARGRHAEREVADEQAFVRGMDVALGDVEAAQDRRNPLVAESRDDRQGSA
jgi:hypothetical protein